VLLYNVPAMSGVTFRGELLDRLMTEFPEAIGGMKDSSNDRALQLEAIGAYPQLCVFPSSEADLPGASACGAAGCISATVALSPQLAREVRERGDSDGARRLARRRAAVAAFPLIPSIRHLIAAARDEPAWERSIPPLTPLGASERAALQVAFGAA
jgi:4-hydroxy-tetrahydrodipicolinate synthase